MLHLAISTNSARHYPTLAAATLLHVVLFLLTGCGPTQVQVQGKFPAPLVDPLPLSIGIWYPPEFRNHEFYDEARGPGDSEWVVKTGEAQIAMWDQVFSAMFSQTSFLDELPTNDSETASVDMILVPRIDELQYAIPAHTNIKVYEIWMRYRFQLLGANGDTLTEWTMTSYGKTPTAFLQSDSAAVNLAAVMALRDAGANFTFNFDRVPGVQERLEQYNRKSPQLEVAP